SASARPREHRPPAGFVHRLLGAERGDEQAKGRHQPDQALEDESEVSRDLREELVDFIPIDVHLMASCSWNRFTLTYMKGMMTRISTTAIALPHPVLKSIYISLYMRFAMTSVQ